MLIREIRSRASSLSNYMEFSDATSSDWSVFTSSDDSSFTTESTRDSVDHGDLAFSSIFQSMYPVDSPSRRTVSCSNALSSVSYGSGEWKGGVPQTSSADCRIW